MNKQKQSQWGEEEDQRQELAGSSFKKGPLHLRSIDTEGTKVMPDIDQRIKEEMLERSYKQLQYQAQSQHQSQQSPSTGRGVGGSANSSERAGGGAEGGLPSEAQRQPAYQGHGDLRRQAQEVIHAAETNIQDELINRENDWLMPRDPPPKMHFDFEKDQYESDGEEGIDESEDIDEANIKQGRGQGGHPAMDSAAGAGQNFGESIGAPKLNEEDENQHYGGRRRFRTQDFEEQKAPGEGRDFSNSRQSRNQAKDAQLPLQASAYFGQRQESNKRSLSGSSPPKLGSSAGKPETNADLREGHQDQTQNIQNNMIEEERDPAINNQTNQTQSQYSIINEDGLGIRWAGPQTGSGEMLNMQENSIDSQEQFKKAWSKTGLESGRSEKNPSTQQLELSHGKNQQFLPQKIIIFEQQDSEQNASCQLQPSMPAPPQQTQSAFQPFPPNSNHNYYANGGLLTNAQGAAQARVNFHGQISSQNQSRGAYDDAYYQDPYEDGSSDQHQMLSADSYQHLQSRQLAAWPRMEGARSEKERDDAVLAGHQLTFENNEAERSEPKVWFAQSDAQSGRKSPAKVNNDVAPAQGQDELGGTPASQSKLTEPYITKSSMSQSLHPSNPSSDPRQAGYLSVVSNSIHQGARPSHQIQLGMASRPNQHWIGSSIQADSQQYTLTDQIMNQNVNNQQNNLAKELDQISSQRLQQRGQLRQELENMASENRNILCDQQREQTVLSSTMQGRNLLSEPDTHEQDGQDRQEWREDRPYGDQEHQEDPTKWAASKIDKNYRNYSVLSKVVKDAGSHSRAIESSLKVMQEAQRAIQLTINTTETSQSGVFSNRQAMVRNPGALISGGLQPLAQGASGVVDGLSASSPLQEAQLTIHSGEQQLRQIPSFSNINPVNVDSRIEARDDHYTGWSPAENIAVNTQTYHQNQTMNESKINENSSYIPSDIHQQDRDQSAYLPLQKKHIDQQYEDMCNYSQYIQAGAGGTQVKSPSKYKRADHAAGAGGASRSRSPLDNVALRSPAASSNLRASQNQSQGHSRSKSAAGRKKDSQNSALALLKKTGALVKNPPAVSSYKSVSNQADPVDDSLAESEPRSEQSRPKSQNRRYLVGKLFKKATGVDLNEYKKAQAYRENIHEKNRRQNTILSSRSGGSRGSATMSGGLGAGRATSAQQQTHSLRIKRRSRSRSHEAGPRGRSREALVAHQNEDVYEPENDNPQALRRKRDAASRSRHKVSFAEDSKPQDLARSESKVSNAQSKINRYKQIERDLEGERQIQRQAEMIREREAWEAEQARLAEEREIERQRQIRYERGYAEERERQLQRDRERDRLAQLEQERQSKFVQDTMRMMARFEAEHPSLEFSGRFTAPPDGLVREDVAHQDEGRPSYENTTEFENINQPSYPKSLQQKAQCLRRLSRDKRTQSGQNSNFTLGHNGSPPASIHSSPPRDPNRSRQGSRAYSGFDQPRWQMSPTPDFQIPDLAPNYDLANKNAQGLSSSRGALIKLNKMLPDESRDNIDMAVSNVARGQQLQNRNQNESLYGLGRDHMGADAVNMPSRMHGLRKKSRSSQRRDGGSRTRHQDSEAASRGHSQAGQNRMEARSRQERFQQDTDHLDFAARNERLREHYLSYERNEPATGHQVDQTHQERSRSTRSRPDMLPCRGPSSTLQGNNLPEFPQRPQLREASPNSVISGMDLKSNFAQRLAQMPSFQNESHQGSDRKIQGNNLLRFKSHEAGRTLPAHYQHPLAREQEQFGGLTYQVYHAETEQQHQPLLPSWDPLQISYMDNQINLTNQNGAQLLGKKRAKSSDKTLITTQSHSKTRKHRDRDHKSKQKIVDDTRNEVLKAIEKVHQTISLIPNNQDQKMGSKFDRKPGAQPQTGAREYMDASGPAYGAGFAAATNSSSVKFDEGSGDTYDQRTSVENSQHLQPKELHRYVNLPPQYFQQQPDDHRDSQNGRSKPRSGKARTIQLNQDQYCKDVNGYVSFQEGNDLTQIHHLNEQLSQSQTTIAQSHQSQQSVQRRVFNDEKNTNESAQAARKTASDTIGRLKQSEKISEQLLKKARDHRSRSQSRSLSQSRHRDRGGNRSTKRSGNGQNSKPDSRSQLDKSQSGRSRQVHDDQSKMSIVDNQRVQAQQQAHQSQHSSSHQASKRSKDKNQAQRKAQQQQTDLKKLMDLQVQQAQMLMDLQAQFLKTEGTEPRPRHDMLDQSECRPRGETSARGVEASESRDIRKSAGAPSQSWMHQHQSAYSMRSNMSTHQKTTMDLIQAIYKQMEKINSKIARKEQIEEERFREMERKMKKLQRKYAKVREQNVRLEEGDLQSHDVENHGSKLQNSLVTSSLYTGQGQQYLGVLTGRSDQASKDNLMLTALTQQNIKGDKGDLRLNQSSSMCSQSYEVTATGGQNDLKAKLGQINETLAHAEKQDEQVDSGEGHEVDAQQVDFNQQFPSQIHSLQKSVQLSQRIQNSSKLSQGQNNNNFGAQYPSMKSMEEAEQRAPSQSNDQPTGSGLQLKAGRSENAYGQLTDPQAIKKVEYKLHTIQSLVNENDYSSNGGLGQGTTTQSNVPNHMMLSNQNSIENVNNRDHGTKDSRISENEHSREDLEHQIHQMNEAVLLLRDEHKSQIDNMKQFYDDQLAKIRQEVTLKGTRATESTLHIVENSSTTAHGATYKSDEPSITQDTHGQEMMAMLSLQKLMDQDKFTETVNQLNQAVSQKDQLEQRLHRIKEKIKVAKNIKFGGQSAESSYSLTSATNLRNEPFAPGFRNQFRIPTQTTQTVSQQQMTNRVFGHDPSPQNIQQPAQSHNNLDVSGQVASHQQSVSTPHSITESNRVPHQIVETQSQQCPQQYDLSKMESYEDFSKKLNYQYMSKDLNKQRALAGAKSAAGMSQIGGSTGPPVPPSTRSQQPPHTSQHFASLHQQPANCLQQVQPPSTCNNRFMQPFRPDGSATTDSQIPQACQILDQSGPALADVYLQDTSQSMLHVDLGTDSRRDIMQDCRKGINQKIVDLQNLQSVKAGPVASGQQSRQQVDDKSEAMRYLQVSVKNPSTQWLNANQPQSYVISSGAQSSNENCTRVAPSEDQSERKTSPQGSKRVLTHISNLESIRNRTLLGQPYPVPISHQPTYPAHNASVTQTHQQSHNILEMASSKTTPQQALIENSRRTQGGGVPGHIHNNSTGYYLQAASQIPYGTDGNARQLYLKIGNGLQQQAQDPLLSGNRSTESNLNSNVLGSSQRFQSGDDNNEDCPTAQRHLVQQKVHLSGQFGGQPEPQLTENQFKPQRVFEMQIQNDTQNMLHSSSDDPRDLRDLTQSEGCTTNRVDTDNTSENICHRPTSEEAPGYHTTQFAMGSTSGGYPVFGSPFPESHPQQVQNDGQSKDNQSTITKPMRHVTASEVQQYIDYTFKKPVGDNQLEASRGSTTNHSYVQSIQLGQTNHVLHEIDLGAARYGRDAIGPRSHEVSQYHAQHPQMQRRPSPLVNQPQ